MLPDAHSSSLLLALDLAGTFAFGLSGGLAGVRARLDLYGVVVLAGVVGLAGGITRDILLGALPPATFSDWRYLAVAALAGLTTFFFHRTIERFYRPVAVFDAAGLSLFCVTGAAKALEFNVGAVQAVLLGVVTATGGGMLRDVLVREIPTVLRSELYAVPALIGASITVAGSRLGYDPTAASLFAAAACFLIRLASLRFGIGLPTPPDGRGKPGE
ncbi:MAG: trimeric intracellular cation channel family protein [Rubrobacteraceae bacterium]|nr:trimeric intracellular cation channel family protein [Rubrobacteraceae bacterium]